MRLNIIINHLQHNKNSNFDLEVRNGFIDKNINPK